MTHSIPDGFSTVFHTPYGGILHTGDFKIDQTPIDNKPIDLQSLAEAGINIQMISTSEVKVSCVVDAVDCDRAIAALCHTFEINSSSTALASPGANTPADLTISTVKFKKKFGRTHKCY
jgi:hypothetical protein